MTLYRPSGRFKGQIKRLVVQGALVPVEPDHSAMAKRIIEWTYEPEGETTLGELVVELAALGVGEDTT